MTRGREPAELSRPGRMGPMKGRQPPRTAAPARRPARPDRPVDLGFDLLDGSLDPFDLIEMKAKQEKLIGLHFRPSSRAPSPSSVSWIEGNPLTARPPPRGSRTSLAAPSISRRA